MKLIDFIRRATEPTGVPFKDQGRDFTGWDCWGLVVKAYRDCFEIALPGYEHISALSSQEAGELFQEHARSWEPILEGQERPGDVILLRHGHWPCHVGLIIKPGSMLHCDLDIDTCVAPYNSGLWKTRVIGRYRHIELARHN
ncbi:MAG: NlpC/P60 family protein [Candidatus Micrarchaeia archaeon]|jgi:cell wall-associated NlpC family hydrolase